MTLGMAMMGTGLSVLALIPLNNSLLLIEAALLAIGCGLGLDTGPVNAVAGANVPPAQSGTASGLANTACMVGANCAFGTGSEQRVLRAFALGQERERLTRDVCLKMRAFLVRLESCFIPKQFVE